MQFRRWAPLVLLASACSGATDRDAEDDTGTESVDCSELSPDDDTVAGGSITAVGFPHSCNPSASEPGEYTCCSTDPAAPGGLPSYQGHFTDGAPPYFAAHNNALGDFGL